MKSEIRPGEGLGFFGAGLEVYDFLGIRWNAKDVPKLVRSLTLSLPGKDKEQYGLLCLLSEVFLG